MWSAANLNILYCGNFLLQKNIEKSSVRHLKKSFPSTFIHVPIGETFPELNLFLCKINTGYGKNIITSIIDVFKFITKKLLAPG